MVRNFYTFLISFLLFVGLSEAQVVADFTANNTQDCSPLVVQFNNQSTGNITYQRWFFGNGNQSLQQNPGAVYITPGTYDVTLVVSDGTNFDTLVRPNYITVFENPNVNFEADVLSGCAPLTVNFSDLTTVGSAPITTYNWNFGDGSSSNQQNPTHTYTSSGSYHVTLVTVDANGCRHERTFSNYIQVSPLPDANFTADEPNSCLIPHEVQFTPNISPISNYTFEWDFGNGDTSSDPTPTNTYNQFGNYDVTLTVTDNNGCSNQITYYDYINIEPIDVDFNVTNTTACEGQSIQFNNTSSSSTTSWNWDFGDGTSSSLQNPTKVFTSPGFYTISLQAWNSLGCYGIETKTTYINVLPSPIVDFSADETDFCSTPFQVGFTNHTPDIVDYQWNFGDGNTSTQENPTHTYQQFGSFNVTLEVTDINGCSQTLTLPDYINIEDPVANFTSDTTQGCIPLDVQFTDLSNINPAATSWIWDFGDGNTSTAQNPLHTYEDEGIYDVSLIVMNDLGCSDTITIADYIMVGEPPIVDFVGTPTQACLEDPISFTDLSNVGDQWFWQFGDGGTSWDQNPTYTYNDTGSFDVSLITYNLGCPDTLIIPDYIYIAPPRAEFEIVRSCDTPYFIEFNDLSLAPDTWFWDFGDGNTSTDQNPTHTYASTGNYTISLTVEHIPSGCEDTYSMSVTITDPEANFSGDPLIGCAPLNVQFTDSSTDANNWTWTSGGITSNQQNPNFIYNTPGVYDVSLIIEDVNGCTDTLIIEEYVTVLGTQVDFTADPLVGCRPLEVDFESSTLNFGGNVLSYNWDFGDGNTGSGENTSHTYTQNGVFTVTLEVEDDNGCVNNITYPDLIEVTFPSPAFTGDTISCTGAPVSFNNQSTGNGLSWFWDFGDGNTSTDENPVHSYLTEGFFSVSLTVTDENGCDSTITYDDYVWIEDPVAGFVADTNFATCPPLLVNFEDASTGFVNQWQWDFGDGSGSNMQDPSHIYTLPGGFDLTLIVTSEFGCTDTIFIPEQTVINGPLGEFVFDVNIGCTDLEVNFEATSENTAFYTWDFGDGSVTSSSDSTTTHTYTNPGVFYPVLILDNGIGCQFSVPSPDSIVVGTIQPDFTSNSNLLCEPGDVYFGNLTTSEPALNYVEWHFGDGNTSNSFSPVHNYGAAGVYDVTLYVANDICSDTLTLPAFLEVDPGPVADFSKSDSVVCRPATVIFTDESTSLHPIQSWEWDFGDGQTSTSQNPVHTYTTAGQYTITLSVTNINGCQDVFTREIEILDLPIVTTGNDEIICTGDTVQLNAGGGISYDWSPSASLIGSNTSSPFAFPTTTTTYTVVVTDTNNCQSSALIEVVVNQLPTVSISPDTAICPGETVDLFADGGVNYQWVSDSTLSCLNCQNPTAAPVNNNTYTVIVTDANNCVNSESVNILINDVPFVSIDSIKDVSCFDGNDGMAIVSGQGGNGSYDYVWSTYPSQNDSVATNLSIGSYTVTVTDGNGCFSDTTLQINQPDPLNLAFETIDVSCFEGNDGQITALVSGGTPSYSFSWDTNPTQQTQVANDLTAGTYQVLVTDENSCEITDSITISEPDAITHDLVTTDVSCFNGSDGTASISAFGGTSPYSFIWSADSTINSNSISGLTAGNHSVTIVDSMNCLHTVDFTINQPNNLEVVFDSENISCFEGNDGSIDANISGGTAPYTYQWNTNPVSSGSSISQLEIGTYVLIVTDANNCVLTDSVTLSQPDPLELSFASTDVSCFGFDDGTATVNASGGVGNYQYNWLTNPPQTDSVAQNLFAGTYTVEVTDGNNCLISGDVEVFQPDTLSATVSTENVSCYEGNDGLATVSANGGVGNYTYEWNTNPPQFTETAINLTADMYTVIVRDSNNCEISVTAEITEPAPLTSDITSSDVTCFDGSDGFASTIISGGTAPYSYQWNTNPVQNSDSINSLSAGWYNLTAIDANNCLITDSIEISQPDSIIIHYDIIPVSCNGESDGSITVNPVGGTPGYQYYWSSIPTQYTQTASNLVAGHYNVTVTDENSCEQIQSIELTEPDPIVLQLSSTPVACFGENNGTASVIANGGNGGYTYEWLSSPTQNTTTATQLESGFYSVIVRDSLLCESTGTVEVTQPDSITLTLVTEDVLCFGETNGSAEVHAIGGVGNYTYEWNTNPVQNSALATNLGIGTYTVSVLDSNMCESIITAEINQPDELEISTQVADVSCFGYFDGEVNATVTGGTGQYSYIWDTNPTQTDSTATNLPAGNYNVIVNDQNNCLISANAIVSQPDSIAINTITEDVSCFNGSDGTASVTAFGGVGGYTYLWNTSPPQTTPQVTNLYAGNYEVTIEDANNCISVQSLEIFEPTPIDAIVSTTDVSCFGGNDGSATVLPSGGTSPYTYEWLTSPVQVTETAIDLTAGTYEVIITDSNECEFVLSQVEILEPLDLELTIDTHDIRCFGEDNGAIYAFAGGGTAPYSYLWNTGSTDSTILSLTPGYYDLAVVDDNGCTINADSIPIVEPAPIESIYAVTNESCPDAKDGYITTFAFGGNAPYQFNWDNGQNGTDLFNLSGGIYELTITDNNGCVHVENINVITDSINGGILNGPFAVCPDQQVTIQAYGDGDISWSPSESLNCEDCTTVIAKPDSTTQYILEVYYTPNCIVRDSVQVVIHPKPEIDAGPDIEICLGETATLDANGALFYSWVGTEMSCTDCPNPEVSPVYNTVYNVVAINQFGCFGQDSLSVIVNPIPDVQTSPDLTLCEDDETIISAYSETAVHFSWFNISGDLLANTEDIEVTASGQDIYFVEVENEFGCTNQDAVVVNVIDVLDVSVTEHYDICLGQSVELQAEILDSSSLGTGFVWLPAEEIGQGVLNPVVSPTQNTEYSIIVYSGSCAPDTHSVTVNVYLPPHVNAGNDQIVVSGSTVDLQATPNNNSWIYEWEPYENIDCPECPQTTYFAENDGYVHVNVTDEYGCVARDSLYITTITECGADIFVPNTFTPNGDEINDKVYVRSREVQDIIFFRIFNRWGELLFETNDMSQGWDGRHNGIMLNADVFAYHVRATCGNGQIVEKYGNVTLLR
ncbi:MAG: PKD domain-containing protein [Chitinophagaceae bacterium]|nr:MAG: PKD domain-containing protein [Chitinophagaceae bacterium]